MSAVEPVNCATGDQPTCPTCGDDMVELFPCGCQVYECNHTYDCSLGWLTVDEELA